MARGVNKVILIGHLGSDPESRFMPNGNAVANTTLATSESWKDKQTGQRQEKTEWHRLVFFNRLAEVASEYLKKGAKIYVEGKIQTRKWQDSNGQDRYTTEIVVNDMQMLDSRSDNAGQHQYQPPQPQPQPQQHPQSNPGLPPQYQQQNPNQWQPPQQQQFHQPQPQQMAQGADTFDDDIPFN